MTQFKKQICLIILDGWGYSENTSHNAIASANTPNFNSYWNTYPHTLLEASGFAVGLPEGQMGNSEIGHTTIGAGKAMDTDLVRIKKAIEADEFVTNPAFIKIFDHVTLHNSILHVKGLLGNGGVHAHTDHLIAFLEAAKRSRVKKIAIHVFTDGRDTAPQSSVQYLEELETALTRIGIGFIATATGRFYAMDRDNNWDRLAKAESAIYECVGNICHINKDIKTPSEYIKKLHKEGVLDEHLEPVVFLDENGQSYPISQNDGVFFFNFRADRARMLAKNIAKKAIELNLCFVTLTEYQKELNCLIAFPKSKITTTLAKEISEAHLTQAHIAETEKFPHATYFLNGGVEIPYTGESHIMLESRKDVQTHDLAPKMRAEDIAREAISQIKSGTNFIFINFANPDMVGHTANVPAIIEAIEEVDTQLGHVVTAMLEQGIKTGNQVSVFITADHGNAEMNFNVVSGEKHTAHTINPVPAIYVSNSNISFSSPIISSSTITKQKFSPIIGGNLTDIAPTILTILDIDIPQEMTGKNLLFSLPTH